MKDYFSILGVKPSAGIHEIKQAYRKLAMNYHPDKHQQDPEKSIIYEQIREAYEILTDPYKRTQYLEQRWLLKAKGEKLEEAIMSSDHILKKVIELNKNLRFTDPERINKEQLLHSFLNILSEENIATLIQQNDLELNTTIVTILIDTLQHLPIGICESLRPIIYKIPCNAPTIKLKLENLITSKRKKSYWEKRKIWIVLLLTILICFLIAMIS